MGWKDKLRNVFSRGHKDIYEAVKEYAQERGVATTDVVASAVSSYLAQDSEGKPMLEAAMEKHRKEGGGGGGDITSAVDMFSKMADSMTKMFTSVNELRSSVSIGAMVSDFETVTGAVERIKGLGAEKGTGSIEDRLADAFVIGLINKFTGGAGLSKTPASKKGVETGQGKVEVIEK